PTTPSFAPTSWMEMPSTSKAGSWNSAMQWTICPVHGAACRCGAHSWSTNRRCRWYGRRTSWARSRCPGNTARPGCTSLPYGPMPSTAPPRHRGSASTGTRTCPAAMHLPTDGTRSSTSATCWTRTATSSSPTRCLQLARSEVARAPIAPSTSMADATPRSASAPGSEEAPMNHLRLDRRRLLAGMGGLSILAGLGPIGRVLASPRLGPDPFTLGVAAGDPLPDGFVIWTRLAPQPLAEHGGMPTAAVPVRWEVSEDPGFARISASGEAIARPELAHSVHVELAGLRSARPYWYRFRVEGSDASPVGAARTAPQAGTMPDRVRLAVAGCQAYFHGWFDAWRHLANEPDLDAVFHYGDYIYEGPAGRNKHRYPTWDSEGRLVDRDHVGGEIYSLDDYRR